MIPDFTMSGISDRHLGMNFLILPEPLYLNRILILQFNNQICHHCGVSIFHYSIAQKSVLITPNPDNIKP
jgi:hypothetical protein